MAIQLAIFLLATAGSYAAQPLPWRRRYVPLAYLWWRFARLRFISRAV